MYGLAYLGIVGLLPSLSTASPLNVKHGLTNRTGTLENPVLWQDHPDLDVFRVGDVFYYSSSSFAFSPGAPVLKSYDLANWTPVSHSVPTLNFGSQYNLENETSAYVRGIWASTLRYRESTDTFIWIGCIEDNTTYVWTADGTNAAANNGEVSNWNWTSAGTLPRCYYDNGLFIDDDDKMYVVYGKNQIMLAELNADGTAEIKNQQVFESPDDIYIEGSRMYKINGMYYIFATQVPDGEWVLKADNPWGPYEAKVLVDRIEGPLPNAGYSHQGGVVDTQDGNWYYVAFMDAYPGGRIPVVAPLTWTEDGWPQLVTDENGAWGKTYPVPVATNKTVPPPTGLDAFDGTALSHEWEWNHNPDNSKWKIDNGLQLQTATVTNDLFSARNTLTRRILGPKSSGTFKLDISKMASGDRAGAVLFRNVAAYIGIHKDNSTANLVMVDNLSIDDDWKTNSTGSVIATGPALTADTTELYLRIESDITPAFSNTTEVRQSTFWYSTDCEEFTQLGPAYNMKNQWQFFSGYRFGVFNFATKALNGEITVKSFELELL
jgi:beta-xylosidase